LTEKAIIGILSLMKKLVVDKDKCLGCGTCVALAPKVFRIGDNGKAEVIDQEGEEESVIQNAIDSCPVNAIGWQE